LLLVSWMKQALLVLFCFVVYCHADAPKGMTTFFSTEQCPPSWSELGTTKGRLILSVIQPSEGGRTLGNPLSAAEAPTHTHPYSVSVTIPEKEISADSCCDDQGACKGTYVVKNQTQDYTSGVPFTQLKLCTLNTTNSETSVPFGTVAYFDPSVQQCPTNWTLFSESDGRFLVPGWEVKGTTTSDAPALSYGADIVHSHNISSADNTLSIADVSYAGIAGCCNDNMGESGTVPFTGSADPESANIPYIQMLTCISQEKTVTATNLPTSANLFNTVGCPEGWAVDLTVAGRFLVSLPTSAVAGAAFGGDSMPAHYTGPAGVHSHDFQGNFDTDDCGIGLVSGCCADGYARDQSYSFKGVTDSGNVNVPYVSLPFCSHK